MVDLDPILAVKLGKYVLGIGLIWLVLGLTLAVVMSVVQERKIWKPKSLPSLSFWGMLKVAVFNFVWCFGCFLGAIFIVVKYILMLGQSDLAYDAHCLVEQWVAHICILVFVGRVDVKGVENLPIEDAKNPTIPAPVYVSNHASQIDVGVVYFINRRFKWIAKFSVLYLPGVGQIMALAQHVLIKRKGKNKKSVSNLFEKSGKAVMEGISMFFFPQGTRWMADRLPFKDGAYIVAQNNQSPIVPLSIDIPRNAWNSAYPFNGILGGSAPVITITVHPPIPVNDKSTREELKNKSMEAIYSAVPTILQGERNSEAKEKVS